jgi:dienelactone hydrolase
MKATFPILAIAFVLSTTIGRSAVTATLPAADQRALAVRDLNTPRTFPDIASKAEWQARAKDVRENTLVSCGLWPMPEKTLLNAKIFDRVERDGYSVEKVHFQSSPGFYVGGNLYRPLGKGRGPFPGVLNPHGHWAKGRLADEATGSIAARCISFARMGMVAFSWDMAGYNDTIQLGQHRKFFLQPELQLWNLSLMGLQTWNSIRALDFLASLPDVDPKRLACTGESGGGTQTFMLGAVDDRLALQAPIVMVSHTMQGGCQCENAPGLRVDHFNVEIAAVPVPRPQMLVACTGDWTKATMTVEGPALERIYTLFKADDRLRYRIFNYNHNYNQTSREAVYPWFKQWLQSETPAEAFPEPPYTKEPDKELRVFPDDKPPADALDEKAFIKFLIAQRQAQFAALKPQDKKSLARFKEVMTPAWRHSLKIELPERDVLVDFGESRREANYSAQALALGRAGKGDRIPALVLSPRKDEAKGIVLLANEQGRAAYLDASGAPTGLVKMLLDRGLTVMLFDTFLTGELANPKASEARKPFEKMFTTYNRTDLQERVQDLITGCAFARNHSKMGRRPVILCGSGRAGLWALLAAPAADAVVADCDQLDATSDSALLAPGLFAPGLRIFGGFEGAAALAAPNPLVLHNTGDRSSTELARAAYSAAGGLKSLRVETAHLDDDALVNHIIQLKTR